MLVSLAVSTGHHGAAEAAGLHPPRGRDRTGSPSGRRETHSRLWPWRGDTGFSLCLPSFSLCVSVFSFPFSQGRSWAGLGPTPMTSL